eukprot:343315-Prorocentrum_minimum.AAC.1
MGGGRTSGRWGARWWRCSPASTRGRTSTTAGRPYSPSPGPPPARLFRRASATWPQTSCGKPSG